MTKTGNHNRAGQTLVIALMITFIMLFLGLIFVGIIARNLFFTQRGTAAMTADNFADSGIRFSHDQLMSTPQGADWRPSPTNLPPTQNRDPDYAWLRAPDPNIAGDLGGPQKSPTTPGAGSFTRINFDQGRALIRVSYNPDPVDPLSKYIMIDSVGRVGVIRDNDPTVFTSGTSTTFREKIAYAVIGITDYTRFDTDKDHKGQPIDLGVNTKFGAMFADASVEVPLIFGDPVAMVAWDPNNPGIPYGAPCRFNGELRLFGETLFYLNPEMNDKLEVVGGITYAPNSVTNTTTSLLYSKASAQLQAGATLFASTSTSFLTYSGLVRDGRRYQDAQGYMRQLEFLEPPVIDQVDQATGRERYRAATVSSGAWKKGYDGNYFNTGRIGYGQGIYVDNFADVQRDVTDFAGGASLRSEWLNPNGGSPNWQGPYYVPPGCFIELIDTGNVDTRGFRIVRNARDDSQIWKTLDNQPTPNHSMRFYVFKDVNSPTGLMIYPEIAQKKDAYPFNGVIYCEGNARVRGIIPATLQFTIVSNSSIYVEGSITKGIAANENGVPSSALSLLAHDYICLNTTQFVGPAIESPLNFEPDAQDVIAPYHINITPGKPFNARFSFGVDPATYTGSDDGKNPRIYLRHASEAGGYAFFNMLVNYGFNPANSEYLFNSGLPNYAGSFYPGQTWIPTYGLANQQNQVFPRYEHRSFALWPTNGQIGMYNLLANGSDNYLTFQTDPKMATHTGNRAYLLSALAVQPMDVKIEALMYAQEGSFFVIPGPWFNSNPNDRREVWDRNKTLGLDPAQRRLDDFGAYPEYPFYAEPLDILIQIRGAVSENFPPPLADQEEWIRHWGWIPKEYGRSGMHIPDQHIKSPKFDNAKYVPNLLMTYDPVFVTARAGGRYTTPAVRTDRYGRMLPATPMLPVGPKLLYNGEVRP